MPKKRVKRYSALFQQKAVERMQVCGSVSAVARELGVSRSTLYAWKRKADSRLNIGGPPPGALPDSVADLEDWVTLLDLDTAARTQTNGRLENRTEKPKAKARRPARPRKRDRPPT